MFYAHVYTLQHTFTMQFGESSASAHVYAHVYTYVFTPVYTHVHTHVYTHVCAHIFAHIRDIPPAYDWPSHRGTAQHPPVVETKLKPVRGTHVHTTLSRHTHISPHISRQWQYVDVDLFINSAQFPFHK